MAAYRLAGSQDPSNRIDRWKVEGPSEGYPDGKVLELNGPAVELSDEQYSIGSRFLRLEPSDASAVEPQVVDQAGVQIQSLSTDEPPDPGTVPDIEGMYREQLQDEARRVGVDAPGNASKDDLRKSIEAKRAEG
jgi:hypothetical protein